MLGRMDRPPIIAVAACAADFEAVSELLAGVPVACGAAFVVVQHLESGRRLWLAEALAQRTILPVIDAQDGVVPERGHVYVMRTNTTLTLSGDHLKVTPDASGLNRPADALFTSVAEERGGNAVGVVLSGGGSDGALGTQAIKKGGGITFAQYPGSARFPSMPISAIETGCADYVLRPNEIAHQLTRLAGDATPPRGVVIPYAIALGSRRSVSRLTTS
jgi:two-component system CheB/CheR fusion protein